MGVQRAGAPRLAPPRHHPEVPPDYRFFTGSLGEIKRLRAEGAAITLDVDDHDFIPMVQPHLRKWIALYGTSSSVVTDLVAGVLRPSSALERFLGRIVVFLTYEAPCVAAGKTFVYWTGARPNVCVTDVNVVRQVLFDRTGLAASTPRTS